MSDLKSDTLLELGFVDLGFWTQDDTGISYRLDGCDVKANSVRIDAPKALYAFVERGEVRYIGKTARTIRKRFVGYCRPALQQRTNWRCHANIKDALGSGSHIRVFVFTPISDLRYLDFEIDLAAALEDSLIRTFDPPWNGRKKGGQPISEEAEREVAEEEIVLENNLDLEAEAEMLPVLPIITFSIKLGETYYRRGILNPGAAASQFLGKDGEPIEILFDDQTEPVVSCINRTANSSGAVRIIGRNQLIAQWFKKHFDKDDSVEGQVLDSNRILLVSRRPTSRNNVKPRARAAAARWPPAAPECPRRSPTK